MMRITLDLLPKGNEGRKVHLGTIQIANDATGTDARGNYRFTLSKRGYPLSVWKEGTLTGFPRKRLGPYDLLLLCLVHVLSDRLKDWKGKRQ